MNKLCLGFQSTLLQKGFPQSTWCQHGLQGVPPTNVGFFEKKKKEKKWNNLIDGMGCKTFKGKDAMAISFEQKMDLQNII